jgi:hypothetical protein
LDWNYPTIAALAAVVLACVGVGAAVTLGVGRRRRNVWKRFARRHRLRYVEEASLPHVIGTLDGRPFELTVSGGGSDNELGMQQFTMSLGLTRPAEVSLEAWKARTLTSGVERTANPQAVDTGDEEFDRAVVVTAESPVDCAAWLTPVRRQALSPLVASAGDAVVCVEDSWLSLKDRDFIPHIDALEGWAAALRDAARALDSAPGRPTV